jgi:4-amino-4-deoxy-L-arabinose transferase-like glycosyltransferase
MSSLIGAFKKRAVLVSNRIYRRAMLWDRWLIIIAALGAGLRFSRLGDYYNEYYTATVHSMLKSPHNFLFASFDPGGVVMVDKPPFSLWVQSVPAAIFGTSSWAVSLPSVVAGTLAIVVLYMVIKPAFGRLAALVAAFVLAVLPTSIVIDSRNEPDTLLYFILLLAVCCIIRAVQTGRWRWLIAFAVLVGVGFNTKMLVAFLPLPAFMLYYLAASKHRWRQVAVRLSAAVAVLLIVSFAWVSVVALTPADERPYVGSTWDNSIWTLVFEYNGLLRFGGFGGQRPAQTPSSPYGQPSPTPPQPPDGSYQPPPFPYLPPDGPYPPQNGSYPLPPQRPPPINPDVPSSGILGLFGNPQAGQLGWLLPLGLLSLVAVVAPVLAGRGYRRPKLVLDRLRSSPALSQGILWGGWLATAVVVFGLADATSTHTYYLVGVAIPLAAVAGIGFSRLWQFYRDRTRLAWLLPVALLGTLLYQVFSGGEWVGTWAVALPAALMAAAVPVIGFAVWRKVTRGRLARAAVAVGVVSLAIIPLAFALTLGGRILGTTSALQFPSLVEQEMMQQERVANISAYIEQQGDAGSVFTLGAVGSEAAAPFILADVPAVAIGGFIGNDPIFTVQSFHAMAKSGELHYYLMTPTFGRDPQHDILLYIKSTWEDVSEEAGLPPRMLYRYRGW